MAEQNDILVNPIGNNKVKKKVEAVVNFINENKDSVFFVCAHNNPDPDAMASAFGMIRILQFLGVDNVYGRYMGDISHPQNRAMHTGLSIPIKPWTVTDDELVKEDTKFIFVDCAGQQKNMTIPYDPDIVIDHHKNIPDKKSICIHDEIGSCSTLIAELMFSIPSIEFDESDPTSKLHCFDPNAEGMKEISTALAIGIKTDTLDFRSETTSIDDIKAYHTLSRFMSDDKYSKIINYELPNYVFDAELSAWANKVIEAPNLITGLGYLEPTRGDCIPYLADHLMRLQGIQTVMVYGIVDNNIKASLRTISSSIDAGALCEEVFGRGTSGGKQGIAGASASLNEFFDVPHMDDDYKEKFWDLIKHRIEKRFFEATQK